MPNKTISWCGIVCMLLVGTALGQTTGTQQSAADTVNITLRTSAKDASLTKTINVSVGDPFREVWERAKPAPMSVDDDPWVIFPGPGDSAYVFFLDDEASSVSLGSPVYAGIQYHSNKMDKGEFILPSRMRGKACGTYRSVALKNEQGQKRTRFAALGMSLEDVLSFLAPAVDRDPRDEVILVPGAGGGEFAFTFGTRAGKPTLEKVEVRTEGKTERYLPR